MTSTHSYSQVSPDSGTSCTFSPRRSSAAGHEGRLWAYRSGVFGAYRLRVLTRIQYLGGGPGVTAVAQAALHTRTWAHP
eukprot:8708530-Alexandrium_andersonii.AAC.1